jgi:hypothetical protein
MTQQKSTLSGELSVTEQIMETVKRQAKESL